MKGRRRKPRIAIVSPWPPQPSGVADHAASLARALGEQYEIDAYHDPAIRPDVSAIEAPVVPIPAPLLPRLRATRGYRGIVYQMGNSAHHTFLYPLLLAIPGVVTLHDPRLTRFHEVLGERADAGADHLAREVIHDRPEDGRALVAAFPAMRRERGGIPVALANRGVFLNRRVVERSPAVIVHSRWAADQIRLGAPECAAAVHHVPLGADPEPITPGERRAARARFGLRADALVFASLGFLAWGKMNEEAIEAFATVAAAHPDAAFVFLGQDGDDGRAAARGASLGLAGRVRFLGRGPVEDLRAVVAAADVGVNLRRAPTNGETSATLLDFLRRGVPTIVSDVDSFRDEPDDVVVRVRWHDEGMPGLVRAMGRLADDPDFRDRVGSAALAHVGRYHRWRDVAALYAGRIEAVHAGRASHAFETV